VVGGPSGPNVFLYGHNVAHYSAGNLTLQAEGEFVATAGTLWRNIPLPSGAAVEQNAIGFNGHVVIEQGANTVIEGSARGEFTRDLHGNMEARLTVRVSSHGSVDLAIADTNFARLHWEIDGDVDVHLTPQSMSINVGATADAAIELATYDIKWVVDLPAKTVCIPWYYVDAHDLFKSHWGEACARTPEVSHPEIDFSKVSWQKLAEARCGVRAEVSTTGGLSLKLDLDPFLALNLGALDAAVKTAIRTAGDIALPNLL
jgi:hypothetical protein